VQAWSGRDRPLAWSAPTAILITSSSQPTAKSSLLRMAAAFAVCPMHEAFHVLSAHTAGALRTPVQPNVQPPVQANVQPSSHRIIVGPLSKGSRTVAGATLNSAAHTLCRQVGREAAQAYQRGTAAAVGLAGRGRAAPPGGRRRADAAAAGPPARPQL